MAGVFSTSVAARPDRRDFLRTAMLGIGAVNLPGILRLRAEAASTQSPSDTSLILLWQDGGPSHFETFDPKPEAPAEYRGELGAIATRLPGVQFCEVLPRMAQLADKVSIVRSIHQPSSNHVSATHTFITGKDRTGLVSGPPEHPDIGAVIHRMRSGQAGQVPKYVALGKGLHRGGTVYLGQAYGPFDVPGDPNGPDFRVRNLRLGESVPSGRLAQRMNILGRLDRLRRELDMSCQMASLDRFQQQAVDMLTSPAAARAFDLSREDRRVRER